MSTRKDFRENAFLTCEGAGHVQKRVVRAAPCLSHRIQFCHSKCNKRNQNHKVDASLTSKNRIEICRFVWNTFLLSLKSLLQGKKSWRMPNHTNFWQTLMSAQKWPNHRSCCSSVPCGQLSCRQLWEAQTLCKGKQPLAGGQYPVFDPGSHSLPGTVPSRFIQGPRISHANSNWNVICYLKWRDIWFVLWDWGVGGAFHVGLIVHSWLVFADQLNQLTADLPTSDPQWDEKSHEGRNAGNAAAGWN